MDKLLQIANRAGQILLECGAETYRVEETIVRICEAYNVENASSFVLPTGIFSSFFYEGKNYSLVMRVRKKGTDLDLIDSINNLSREVVSNPLPLDELEQKLNQIIERKSYDYKIMMLFGGIGAFGFAFFFQGTLMDALASFVVGAIIKGVTIYLDKTDVSSFINNIVGGFLTTLLSIVFTKWGFGTSSDTIIISAIMLLVPGIAITNAIRDSIAGDLVSGLARIAEAILIAVSVALGTGIALGILMLLGGAS